MVIFLLSCKKITKICVLSYQQHWLWVFQVAELKAAVSGTRAQSPDLKAEVAN